MIIPKQKNLGLKETEVDLKDACPFYSPAMNFLPKTDQIIIFPSKTLHSTVPSSTDDERISISADISIFAKNSENIEQLTTPVNKWLKF